jgi:hypothetical protein
MCEAIRLFVGRGENRLRDHYQGNASTSALRPELHRFLVEFGEEGWVVDPLIPNFGGSLINVHSLSPPRSMFPTR